MSNVSYIESGAKYSIAMSILNKVRHWLESCGGIVLDEKTRHIINESLDLEKEYSSDSLLKQKAKGKMGLSIMYNFRSFDDKGGSVSFQIAEALYDIAKGCQDKNYCDVLRSVLSEKDVKSIKKEAFDKSIKLLKECIWVLGDIPYRKKYMNADVREDL